MNKARIMIVDDEQDFASTLAERLRLRSYEVHVVESHNDTIALADTIKPAVILLDLNLPGISGIEILMTLRNLHPEIEVILLTGHMDLARTIEGLRLDSFHYIIKPFDIQELIQKIDTLREKHV
jgi:DNA-binding response OmpR family regulator